MICEKCGSPMQDSDTFCANCGNPVKPAEPAQEQETAQAQQEPTQAQASQGQEASQTQGQQEPVQTAQAQPWQIAPEYAGTEIAGAAPGAPAKKKNVLLPLILGLAAALVVILGAVCVVNASALNNMIHKSFNSPEEYYRWVEAQTVKDTAESAGTIYNDYFLELMDVYDKSVGMELGFELGEEGKDLVSLAGLAGLDLSWLESASVAVNMSNKSGLISWDMSSVLNGNPLLSASAILDMDNQMLYAQAPELSSVWLGFDAEYTQIDSYAADEYAEAMEELERVLKACPDQKEVETLVGKYFDVVLGCLDDVEMEKTTIEAEGMTQKCTALEVTIDEKVMEDIIRQVAENVDRDRDLENLIKKMAPIINEDADPEELYNGFVVKLKDELEDLQYEIDLENKIKMTVYVDGKGKICGRGFSAKDSYGDKTEVYYVMPRKGSDFGFEYSVVNSGAKIKMTGSGKYSGDQISGDFDLKYNGAGIVKIRVEDFDLAACKKGYANGKFTITPNKALAALLQSNMSDDYGNLSWLQDLKVEIGVEMSKGSYKAQISVYMDTDHLGSVTVASKYGKGTAASVPGEVMQVEEESDLIVYLNGVDWDLFTDRLRKCKLPSEIVDRIEGMRQMLNYF